MANGKIKRAMSLAITMCVIAVLFSADFAFAGQTKLNAQEVERIKTALDIVKTASNFGSVLVDGGNLTKVLNTAIKGGETVTDATYGLLVLSAINEIELIDLVISGEYKTIARNYFDKVLDERTSLRSYWKGAGYDIPRVVSGKITSPIGALTLNTFEITDKVISIFSVFNAARTAKEYDGLWHYFSFRRSGDSHQEAWELVEEQMGWAVANGLSFYFKKPNQDSSQLESQFAALWDKWGLHTAPYGVTKAYKEQAKGELRQILADAVLEQQRSLAKNESGPSLISKIIDQLASIKNIAAQLAFLVNPFKAGPIIEMTPAETETAENGLPLAETASVLEEPAPEQPQQAIEQRVSEPPSSPLPAAEESAALEPVFVAEAPQETAEVKLPQLCEKQVGALPNQYRALINEAAFSSEQFIEFKNIWGIPLNLSGWQLQSKDKQIQTIFNQQDIIPASGYFTISVSHTIGASQDIYLFDNQCNLEDEFINSISAPAGGVSAQQTLQRFDKLYWYAGPATFNAENSPPPASLTKPSAPQTQNQHSETPHPSSPSRIVVINEIAWAGTKANSADEWIELHNNTSSAINMTGWQLAANDGTPGIVFSTSTIPANGYFLLERTDDNAVSNVPADLIYTGAMNNGGEVLTLKDGQGNLIDGLDFSAGWPAGQASPNYISMERISPTSNDWASNNLIARNGLDAGGNKISGTPKAENSVSKSQTQVPDTLPFDEFSEITLTYLGNPYTINTLTVPANKILTIEPGVVIKFNNAGRLYVDGALRAEGTQEQKILFTSASANPVAGSWHFINFSSSSSANSRFKNAIVRYGGWYNVFQGGTNAKSGAVKIDGVSPIIENITFEYNFYSGLDLLNSNTAVKNSIFRDNNARYSLLGLGSYSRGLSISYSNPNLTGTNFERNYHGIYVDAGDCPGLSGVIFGSGADSNTYDVFPESCGP